jgi:hypothetical protein
MYYIVKKATRELIRQSDRPFNVDETVQPEDTTTIQLKHVEDNTGPAYDPATQKLEREFVDDDAAFTRTFRYKVVAMTTAEQTAYQQGLADETERQQIKSIYQDLKNGTGTTAARLARVEKVCAWLLRDAVRR